MSTYRTYKAGTKRLTTWLVQAAKLCGVDLTASATDKYQIPLGKFVDLAKTITESENPRIKVPQEIVIIVKTVIALRKEASAIYAKLTGKSTKHASQATHRHFISILEQVLDILAPSSAAPSDAPQATAGADLTNMFAALQVEEPSLDSDAATPASAKAKAKKQPPREYEIEDSASEDALFAVLGFLKDFGEIETLVMQTWMHYRDGRLNLMAASVTTDTAYGIIKRGTEDLMAAVPKINQYSDLISMFWEEESIEGDETTASLSGEMAAALAVPAESILSDYADVLTPNIAPVYNGQFGYYQPDKTVIKKDIHEQQLQNQQLLFEFLPNVTKISRLSNHMHMPMQDELTTGLCQMMGANDIQACPMYAIFATQVFLKIHRVLRFHAEEPFEELQATAKRCIATVDNWIKFSNGKTFSLWPAQNDEALRQFKALTE